jgi:hypothetical protein
MLAGGLRVERVEPLGRLDAVEVEGDHFRATSRKAAA